MKKAINKKRNGFIIYQLQQSCNIPLHEMEIDVARCSAFYRAYNMDAVMARVNATPTCLSGERPSKGGAVM